MIKSYLQRFYVSLNVYKNRFLPFLMIMIRYLVLKYTSELPLFDERFVNYGYNKIQYIEQLRFYSMFEEMT